MIDLDAIERAARAAQDNAYIVQTESFTYARFMKEATPATVLALIARLRAAEAALWEGVAIIQECADYEQMIGDETGCDAGNPDGGGIYPCDHCVAIANATALREKARRLSLVLTPPADKPLTWAEERRTP